MRIGRQNWSQMTSCGVTYYLLPAFAVVVECERYLQRGLARRPSRIEYHKTFVGQLVGSGCQLRRRITFPFGCGGCFFAVTSSSNVKFVFIVSLVLALVSFMMMSGVYAHDGRLVIWWIARLGKCLGWGRSRFCLAVRVNRPRTSHSAFN